MRLEIKQVKFLGEKLGEGTFGFVEVVEIRGKICAGKHYRIDHNFSMKMFIREFEIMQNLAQKHIVEYYGYHMHSENYSPVLIMECLETNLQKFLLSDSHKDLPLARKVDLLSGIAQGLEYLHSMSVIHRDLTASNVLLDSKAVPKISDFGNSCITGTDLGSEFYSQSLTKFPGTLNYMAPEAQSSTNYGTEIDIFSFGHLSLFVCIQISANHLLPPNDPESDDDDIVRGRNEVQRRQEYFTLLYENLEEKHSLVILIKKCLSNGPSRRPKAHELVLQLDKMCKDLPTPPPLIITPLKIVQHPESKSVATKAHTNFIVEAIGDNLQFQWQKDGKNIDRNESRFQCIQTNKTSTLHIHHVEKGDRGHYKCLVKNLTDKSERLSNVAKLTVCEYSFVCTMTIFLVEIGLLCIDAKDYIGLSGH